MLQGARAVWWPAGALGAIFLGLLIWQLAISRPYFTGTNSVGVRSVVATVDRGQRLCIPGLNLPAGTGRVQLALFGQPPRFAAGLTLTAEGQTVSSTMVGVPGPGLLAFPQARIPLRPSSPPSVPATVCVTPLDSSISVGGMAGLQANQVPARLDGAPVANRVAVWFLPPAGAQRSLLSELGAIFSRAALFRPGVVGAWTYAVLMFGVVPLIWIASLLLLARSAAGRTPSVFGWTLRTGAVVALIAFVNAASWALITPAFNAPDEPDHFAYAQYLATTGHAPAHSNNTRPPYSTDEAMATNAVDVPSQVGLADTRPPWLAVEQTKWARERSSLPHPANNGGGTTAASPHEAAYYLMLAPAYEVVLSQSPFSQLTAMRLMSALLGALVAFCAYGIVSELLPGQRVAAVTAGLLVAFQPMFGFISGAVNNDNGVNAAAALSLYLLIRALRRGLTWRLAFALGATLAITPFMKGTGYEIYPPVAVGLLGILWRNRRPADLHALALPVAALAAAFALIRAGWTLLQGAFYPTIAGHSSALGGTSASGVLSAAEQYPTRFLVYLWEIFLPRLPFMTPHLPPGWPFRAIYVVSGWGAFGWDIWTFPGWVYEVIVITMGLVGLLALSAAVRWRGAVRRRGVEGVVIALVPICTLVAVEAAFFNAGPPLAMFSEQGRYIFPAIAALAAIAVAGTFAFGRRWHVPLATTLVVAVIGMSYAAQWLTLSSFFG